MFTTVDNKKVQVHPEIPCKLITPDGREWEFLGCAIQSHDDGRFSVSGYVQPYPDGDDN